jgi:light-regulated signal transduction histidine kinase (bacteriophytochrome)
VPPQALPKVISNALRYGLQARVWVQSENELVEIVVDDNGPGIPLAASEAVFSAFHCAESSRNRPTGRRRVAEARRYRIEDERAKAPRVRAFYVTIRTSHCAI